MRPSIDDVLMTERMTGNIATTMRYVTVNREQMAAIDHVLGDRGPRGSGL